MRQKLEKETSLLDPPLAANLKRLMEMAGTNEIKISQALDIPVMTVRRLVSGETADPRISTLKTLANYFGVSVDRLIEKSSEKFFDTQNAKLKFVPLLDWSSIEKLDHLDKLHLQSWEKCHPVPSSNTITIGANGFALESRPSMAPRFPSGTVFIIDPEVAPSDGDLILIKIKDNNEITLRELVIDPPEWRLMPVVSNSASLQYSIDKHAVVGVVLLTLFYNKKTLI